jgi:Protein of unknown function (DUF1573)
MKKAILALSVLFLSVAVFAQTATQAVQRKAEDYIKFKEIKYDFQKIKQGSPVTHDFYFTNASEQAIVIETATPSCGCTTPVFPQAAIAKGKSDKITAGFNAQAVGPFNKTITIKLAGIEMPTVLTITGEVLTPEEFAKYEAAKKDGKPTKSGSK